MNPNSPVACHWDATNFEPHNDYPLDLARPKLGDRTIAKV